MATKKFGTFGGVFTPSILTILGVIMYMRLGWVVGNAGLVGAFLLIVVAHIIAVSTGLSISSIATDKKVGAGGVYYVLSRSLGPYDTFSNAIVVRSSPKSGVLSHSIELAISKPCDIAQVKQSIHMFLLSMPYVLQNQKIAIEHLSDEEQRYLIKVIIHGLDKQQMYVVEGKLKAIFANK